MSRFVVLGVWLTSCAVLEPSAKLELNTEIYPNSNQMVSHRRCKTYLSESIQHAGVAFWTPISSNRC